MGQCSSMGGHGRPQVLHCDNVLCYFTTNIVHRNYISWYVAATVAMKDVPFELRFNWDDTSLFVAGEQRGPGKSNHRCMYSVS